jgi:hypothetical protein
MVCELEGSFRRGIRIFLEGTRTGFSFENLFASTILLTLTLKNLSAISGT